MRWWIAGAVLSWATWAGAIELPAGNPAFTAPGTSAVRPPSTGELMLQLIQHQAEIQRLRTRLEMVDDQRWYERAEQAGVVSALSRYRFADRQKRRLAVTIVREAAANGLDPLLVVAVIRCESSFNPLALSGPGAMGLMQVMPATGRWLAAQRGFDLGQTRNLYDTELNIELGTAYLASLIRQFGSIEHALVAYNAGPGAAVKILANREARTRFIIGYPKKVMTEFKKLKAVAEQEGARRLTSGSGAD